MALAERYRRNCATVVAGCLQWFDDVGSSQSQVRKPMVGHLKAVLPDIMPKLPPGSQAEFRLRLEKMARAPSMKDVRRDLEGSSNGSKKSMSSRLPTAPVS